MSPILAFVSVVSAVVVVVGAEKCLHPPPAEGFTNENYSGRWYEIGKVPFLQKFSIFEAIFSQFGDQRAVFNNMSAVFL
jgi:lipocalin